MTRPPPRFTLLPYTTLFRSPACWAISPARSSTCSAGSSTAGAWRSEEHTSELQSHLKLVCRLLLEKKNVHGQLDSRVFQVVQRARRSLRIVHQQGLGDLEFDEGRIDLFFFNNPPTTEIYTLSLHDALPI